ncbi:MAG TPA: hypothetical protein DEP72_01390 [Clostridiales bacterium]|nr:MAG: hypothetical protein A2Y18_05125 [Clostridiales bacterium GWD2_32_19]HCC06807.1 hypothetical protein [Clostridiales bacterium]
MPRVLKKDTLTLIEGSLETYTLALYGLYVPYTRQRRNIESKYGPIMGLLGATVELLAKACLVQAKDVTHMYKNNNINSGVYKFGTEVIEELKQGIKNLDESFDFIWKDKSNQVEYRAILIEYLSKFKLVQELRAKGLHAGIGVSKDIVSSIINDIYDFMRLLSSSKRLGAYLKNLSQPEATVKDRLAILEDLSRRLAQATDIDRKTDCLRAMYLVLPYVPEKKPEWIDSFEQLAVASPNEQDVSYLVKTLTEAHSIYLLKQRGGKEGVPVKIDNNDPNAVPMSVQYLKRKLSELPDKFHQDVLSANTRFDEKRMDLPLGDFILDIYIAGIENTGILIEETDKLTAQQVWPFVASAISAQGNPRPYWFIIRRCDELDKLKSMLINAKSFGNAWYVKQVDDVVRGIDSIINQIPIANDIDRKKKTIKEIRAGYEGFIKNEEDMQECLLPNNINKYKLSDQAANTIREYIVNGISAGVALDRILTQRNPGDGDKSIARKLMSVSYKYEDRIGLIAVMSKDTLSGYVSHARKTMYYSDYIKFGPDIVGVDRNKF